MTTQTTTIQPSTKRARAFIGAAAATLALLGGALLWQARPASETAAPGTTTSSSSSTINEGVAPMGGLAEQYRDQARAAGSQQQPAVVDEPGSTLNAPYLRGGIPTAPASDTMGGMAEFYAEQQTPAAPAAATWTGSRCGLDSEQEQRAC